ncbi:MAG: hypothetical protein HYT22_00120 [Candidatus Niyogibacteria bacterium]|nr:hypothetical protein [Candidatus Niyogibacteria bacterium]
MEILTNIVSNLLEAQLTEFIGIAEQRFSSWRGTDNIGILKAAVERAYLTARAFSPQTAKRLLETTLLTRIFFEDLLVSFRERHEFGGVCLRGVGQEAVGAGVAVAMQERDILAPDHRSVSAMLARGTTLESYWRNHLMRATGPTGGYDPNTHFADLEHRNIGFMVSDMAMSAGVINGAVWQENRRIAVEVGGELLPEERVAGAAIFGDGAASNGLAHGGMNLAKALGLPTLFVILDNQISFRTSPSEQHGGIDLVNRAFGYEMPGLRVDGDNVYEVCLAASILLDFARRAGHPALLHAVTFRRCGHNDLEDFEAYIGSIHDEAARRFWNSKEKDPVYQATTLTQELGFVTEDECQKIETGLRERVHAAHETALAESGPDPAEERPVFMESEPEDPSAAPTQGGPRTMTIRQALAETFIEAFERDPFVFMIGEDIARAGGAWNTTQGLSERFPDRVINAPLDEGAIAAFAVGAALFGAHPIVEYQFGDFAFANLSPIVTLAATRAFMQKIAVPIILRFPCGYVPSSNHYHEKIPEAVLVNAQGIKVVVSSTPQAARGLMQRALRDRNPVAFIEYIFGYGILGTVSAGGEKEDFCSRLCHEGSDVTIVTWGPKMLMCAIQIADELLGIGVTTEVIDLQVLNPWDKAAVVRSVQKTGRLVVLHEDSKQMGFGAEVAASIVEDADVFYHLRARPVRLAAKNTPIPAHRALEDARLPDASDVVAAVRLLMTEA